MTCIGFAFPAKKRYEEPEPEWVTYGPTSQLETIELRGFNKEEMLGKRSTCRERQQNCPVCLNVVPFQIKARNRK
jgi:hypothetical protein